MNKERHFGLIILLPDPDLAVTLPVPQLFGQMGQLLVILLLL